MSVAIRSYLTAGAALIGVGIMTAGQVVPAEQLASTRMVQSAVRLAAAAVGTGDGQPCTGYHTSNCDIWARPSYTPVALDTTSGSVANIPVNLVNAVLNMPRAWVDGLNDLSYALEVTGNWWVYSPTNVLGFDPADPPKITAMTNMFFPFPAFSNPFGDQLAWGARANLPMNASCTGTVGPACADIGPILSKMFVAPPWTLASGYQFPELYNPVSDAEGAAGEEIPGSTGELVPWSGAYVKMDPMDPYNSVINYLLSDPASNAPKPLTADEVTGAFKRFANALTLAFNPIVPNSYLLKGWPYTALTPLFLPFVPALCPTCDPENPGGPPISPAAAAASTTLVSDVSTEAPAEDASAADDNVTADSAPADRPVTDRKAEPARAEANQARAAAADETATPPTATEAEQPAADNAKAGATAETSSDAADAADTADAADAKPADTAAASPSTETGGKHRRGAVRARAAAAVKATNAAGAPAGSSADSAKTAE